MKTVCFAGSAFQDYTLWKELNTDIFDKINELVFDISRDAFKGIGKPEPLKGKYSGYWSRRINQEHRLIYKVQRDTISIIKCHGHYD